MLSWLTAGAGLAAGGMTLWLPGHLIQRAISGRFDGAISLVISCWLMFTGVLFCQLVGLPVAIWSVGLALALACAWPAYSVWKTGAGMFGTVPGMPAKEDRGQMTPRQRAWALAGLGLCAAVFIGALWVSPISSFDYPTRWDLFPQVLLERGNLSWYPATLPEDYKDYLMPDAMPQALGASVWWLYAWSGTTSVWVSGAFALVQYVALGSAAGRMAGALGARPVTRAVVELLVLSCPLLVRSLALRQEAGLMTLSCIVCLWAICEAKGSWRWLTIAALAGACMMSTREYGGFILLPGVLAAATLGAKPGVGWKDRFYASCIFSLATLALGFPWYAYVWAKTGSPFYTIEIPGLLASHASPVWANLVNGIKTQTKGLFYSEVYLAAHMKLLALNVLPAGLIGVLAFLSVKRWPGLVGAVILLIGLWHWASLSSAGGYEFALRVATPALVLAIILGITWLEKKGALEKSRARLAWGIAAGVLIIHAGLTVVVWRFYFDMPPTQWVSQIKTNADFAQPLEHVVMFALAVDKYPDRFKDAKVLTSNPYIAAYSRNKGVTFVPIWSPEVSFLSQPGLSADERRHRLLDTGIKYVIVEPQEFFYLSTFTSTGLAADLAQWNTRLALGNGRDVVVIPRD